jgi:hypothetical protein
MSTNAMEALLGFDNQLKNPAHKESTQTITYLKKEDLKKKYFSPQEDSVHFRMIPLRADQPHHFSEIAHFHEYRINGHNKKLVCLKHLNGSPCPFCEKQAELKALSNNKELFPDDAKRKELFIESNKYQAREFYILKGIDRGKTGDGVKFWRFKKSYNGTGNYEKLIVAIKDFFTEYSTDITDINAGMDFKISTVNKKMNTGNGTYREVSGVLPSKPLPLSNSPEEIQAWTSDTLTWKDIYKPTSIRDHMNEYEYLTAVLENRAPKWDEVNRKWMFKDSEGNTYYADSTQQGAETKSDAITAEDFKDVATFDSKSNDLPF